MAANTTARCQCCYLWGCCWVRCSFCIPSTAFQNALTVLSDHRHVASTCNGLQRQTIEVQVLHSTGLSETRRPNHAIICILYPLDRLGNFLWAHSMRNIRKWDLWRANSLVEIRSTHHTDGGDAETHSRPFWFPVFRCREWIAMVCFYSTLNPNQAR